MPLFESIEQNNIQEEPKQDWLGQRGYDELVEENNKKLDAQKQEHNLWVQNVVSPEKIAEWQKMGTMSALEVWNRKEKNELVPYMSTIQQADKGLRIKKISDNMQKGLYILPEDKAFYEQFVLDMAEIQTRGYTFGGKVVNAGLETLPFMLEFGIGLLTTGGATSLGASAAKFGVKGAIKKATSEALEGASKKIAEDGILKAAGKGIGKVAYDATLNPRTYAFSLTRMPQQVYARYSDIMLSDSLAISEEGQAILLEAKEKPAMAFLKALGMTNIEVASEMAGMTLFKPVGGALGRFVNQKVMSKLPEKFATRFTKVAEEITGMPFVKGVEALGFNGLIEEMGEERVGDILRYAFDLDEEKGYTFEQLLDAAFPSVEQLAVEAVTFGAMGAGAGLVDAGLKKVSKKYSKDEFLLDAGIFRQEGRDSLLDSQVRSKLEEAGVPEEDIENTLQFGTREQKLDFVRNNINTQSELSKEIETDWYNKLVEAGAQHEQAYRSAKLMSVFIDRFGADEKVKKQWYDKLVVTNKKVEEGKKIALGQAQFQAAASAGANGSEIAEAEKEYAEKGTDSKYFKKWFGDSKVVDENGKPLVVYHGTPNGGFETFREGSYFTANKDYANNYTNVGASALSVKNVADNPQIYEVYLSIKKPFDTRNSKERNIFLNEYRAYYSPELSERGLVDWMEVEDLAEWLKENHPEYDGIIADEGGTGGYGEAVKYRGASYIPFSSSQIKSVDNRGTFDANNPNIYYQGRNLEFEVDESFDLNKYIKSLNVKKNIKKSSENFAEKLELILDDKLASGVEPIVLFKPTKILTRVGIPDAKIVFKQGKIKKVLNEHLTIEDLKKIPELLANPEYIFESATDENGFVVVLTREERPLIVAITKVGKEFKIKNIIKSAYNKGVNFVSDNIKEGRLLYDKSNPTRFRQHRASIAQAKTLSDNNIITDFERGFKPSESVNDDRNLIIAHASKASTINDIIEVGSLIAPSFSITSKESEVLEEGKFGEVLFIRNPKKIDYKNDNIFDRDIYSPRMPRPYFDIPNGRVVDYYEYDSLKRSYEYNPEKFVEKWGKTFEEYFAGAKKVLYLGMTNSGNRRYVPYTAENILKEMKKQGLLNKEGFDYGLSSLLARFSSGQTTKEMLKETAKQGLAKTKDIDKQWEEIKEEYDKLGEKLAEYYYDKWSFYEVQSEAFYAIAKNMRKTINELFTKEVPEDLKQEVKDFVEKAKNLPRSYFEAKPMREIGLNEFDNVLVKKGTLTEEQKKGLESWGVKVTEYKEGELYKTLENLDKENENIYFQSAYHGTPHRFDEFLLDHIGSGEGAQAHGWGLYFAGNKDVSEGYRERLIGGLGVSLLLNGKKVIYEYQNKTQPEYIYAETGKTIFEDDEKNYIFMEALSLIQSEKTKEKAIEKAKKQAENYKSFDNQDMSKTFDEVAKFLENNEIEINQGQLYEVDIPENDVLLDEDKTFDEQPKKVQEALKNLPIQFFDINDYYLEEMTGEDIYGEIVNNIAKREGYKSSQKEYEKSASKLLNSYGIKGITYDGKQDGRCYVVFDDKAVKILNTFYQEEGEINNNFHDLLNRAREKKEQQENEYYGYFVSAEDKNVLSIMQNHNASTIIHEMGHLFLDGLNEFAKVDAEAAEQLAAVNKWLGSDGVYTVAQQEKFARSFEAYLYRGKAPSSMLRKVFEAFKEWMKKIYLDITSIHDADISDEAVEVFDRIFYGNEYAEKNKQIKQLLNKIKTLRADDELTETQKRHRDIAYHIVSLATGKDEKYLKRILENKHPNKSVKKQQENIEFLLEKTDDKISTKDGFLPEWLEFFDEAELYEDETKLAFAAYDTILAGNYRNDTTFADEDYLSYLDAQYNYILKEYQKNPYERDVVLGAYYEWLGSINEEYQENYAERFNADIEYIERRENMDKFERAKEDILSAARSAKNPYSLDTVEVYKDFVLSIMKNLDFLQPIDKARLTTNILENTSVAMLEARIDNILDIAKTMEDLAYRRELVKKIRAELQGTKNVKQGARTVGKYDYKTNKLFERLRELDNLSVEQANDMRLSEEMLMRAQDEGLSFEDKMINRFLTFKANGNTYGTTENIKALFDDIVKIKNAARDAKNEQEMFDKLNLEKNVQELIDIVEAKKEPKAVKWYMQLLGNWESSLNALFNKDIKDKYSLLLAETAADVWIYEQKKRFEDVIAGIYGLNSWNFDKELLKGLSEEYTFNERVRDYDKDFNLIRERIVEKKMNRLEVLLAYIWNKNELMRKRLINMFGEDTLDEMFEVLSVEDKKLGDFMVRMASGFYPEVNEAFIKKYGLDLPKISAYFPSRAEREGSEVDMFNDFTSQTKNDSFTKNRTKSETIALEFGNPIEMLYSHIDGVGKFVYMGERLDKLNKIFKNKTLKRTLKNKYGNDVYKSLFQTLTNITYKAAPPVYSLHGKILNNVISNWIQGNVIFRPIVGLKQLLAANNYAADMPYLDWHIGYLKAIANFKSTIDYMTKIPYLKARFGGSSANEFLKDTINNSAFAASKKFKDLLAMNIKMGDIGAIVFGGKPYIDYLIKQGKTEEEAIEQFVLMTQRTQQSSAISSLSNFQVAMSRNPIGKLFTAYKNSPYQYIRMCGDAIVSVANGDMTLKECAKIIYHFAYVQPLLYTLATSGSILTWLATGDDDELKADLFSTLFNLNADALAFIGDAYKFAIEKLILKEKYMPSTTPLLGDLQMEIMKLSKKEVSAKDYFHAAGYGVHLLTGVDANAVGNSVAGLGDIAKGDVAKGTLRAVGYTENRAKRIVGEKDKKKK